MAKRGKSTKHTNQQKVKIGGRKVAMPDDYYGNSRRRSRSKNDYGAPPRTKK